MLSCINKSSVEYQSLKDKANVSELILDSVCRDFLDKYNRFPYLDEIPGANSEQDLKMQLHITEGTTIDKIEEFTGKDNIQEATAAINNQYRDLEVEIKPLNREALIDIRHRPTSTFEEKQFTPDQEVNNYLIFNKSLRKLGNLYGISFNEISDSDLASEKYQGFPQEVNAFIQGGQIYINTDRASVDAPLHEMMHLFVGSIRFTNPQLYSELVSSVEQWPNYAQLVQQFPNRTRNDINEEIFVTETSKYFTGQPSNLSNISERIRYEMGYNIKRVLDSILMGSDSVKTITEDRLYNLSLKEIAQEVNSAIMTNNFYGTMNVEGSELHRKLNNIKSDLYKKGTLIEQCD